MKFGKLTFILFFVMNTVLAENISQLETACNTQDDVSSCVKLASIFHSGKEDQKDPNKAIKYFKKSCELNVGIACTGLGVIHEEGKLLEKNINLAEKYYKKACDKLHEKGSCTNLGALYININNFKQAEIYSKLGCKLKDAISCNNTGWLLYKQNKLTEALPYYEQACVLFDGVGCQTLGFVYHEGKDSISPDLKKAVKYYKKSCNILNNKNACLGLASIYQYKDEFYNKEESILYATKACKLGKELACDFLEQLQSGENAHE